MDFYSYAKKNFSKKGVAAIITPDGIQKAWDKIERSGGGLFSGLPKLPNLTLPGLPNLTLPGLPEVGDFLPGIGGYLGDRTGLPGAGFVGRAVGEYLDNYV